MESEQHPSSSSLLTRQHDFSSLVSWPHNWQPESFEIPRNPISKSSYSNYCHYSMTQVVPEQIARAKLGSSANVNNNVRKDNTSSFKNQIQRSNSATLSTISVTCDTDTSIRSRSNRPQQTSPKKPLNSKTNLATSHSSTALTHHSVNPSPTSFRNNHHHHHQYKSSGSNLSTMSTSLTTTSGMNTFHEKSRMNSSASTLTIANKHLIKTPAGGLSAGAVGGSVLSTKSLSNKYKASSFDDHHRTNQNRGFGKSVLEHLVFVFPENVRKMLTGPKK